MVFAHVHICIVLDAYICTPCMSLVVTRVIQYNGEYVWSQFIFKKPTHFVQMVQNESICVLYFVFPSIREERLLLTDW